MKKKKLTIISILIFFIGLLILLYPTISNYWNLRYQTNEIKEYEKIISNISDVDYERIIKDAVEYNEKLSKLSFPLIQYKDVDGYEKLLNANNRGMMGYIKIEKIKVNLPIYHGTSQSTLSASVGHLQGSSLPVGGNSTHAVLSAHRGLPSAKLFTDLNKLEIGDIFVVNVFDKSLIYQIDKIATVLPNEVNNLKIAEGEDYVTLLTCTPYGINTHRLLVRGTRIENIDNKQIVVTSDAYQIEKLNVAICIALPIMIIILLYVLFKPNKKGKKEEI